MREALACVTRNAWACVALAISPCLANAQDMPLYTLLIDGEGWQAVRSSPSPAAGRHDGTAPPKAAPISPASSPAASDVTAQATSPDGGTTYLGYAHARAVWAVRTGPQDAAAPYCPLRLRPGQAGTRVTALAVDALGRVCAATPEGIHFFDPTGRFSGLIELPVPGQAVDRLEFVADRLRAEVAGRRYERRIRVPARSGNP